ncbi:hypothetical protein VNO78_20143 [Psophocarpus tetragonolobus]|uniref:C2 NT-type domain-containing protein n=1 Tax=Psophocarpus tetragonolobus TaxID=3891 RepID=A0AAN9SAD3_PSOTE
MVLGIRSKSRKSVSIQVHYIIHVQEIKPWPPSQSLRSVLSVLLQWENGDQISGSLASTAATGKIEFNESFRLSVIMNREISKKGKHRESFQKNLLEFYLYDKTVKSQLLGSATINFADFGIIKETKALTIPLNCKKSFKSSSQPFIYVNIQPFDTEGSSSSSPSSRLSKELSPEKEGTESASQSVKDDEDLEIASFTDDDVDDVPSNTFQTIRSASEITGDSVKISRGKEGSEREFVQPLESNTSSLIGSTEAETSTQFSGIKPLSSSTVLSSDVGNATNSKPLLSKISKETVKLADASSEIRESEQQSSASNISSSKKANFESVKLADASSGIRESKQQSSAANISSSMKANFEGVKLADASSEIQESKQQSSAANISSSMKANFEGVKLADTSSEIQESKQQSSAANISSSMKANFEGVKLADASSEIQESKQQSSAANISSSIKANYEGVKLADVSSEIQESKQQSSAANISSSMKANFEGVKLADASSEIQESKQQSSAANISSSMKANLENVKLVDASSEIRESKQPSSASNISSSMKENFERSFHSQVTEEDSTRDQRFNKDVLEKVSSVSNTRVMEEKEKMEDVRKVEEQFTTRNEVLENEVINNFSDEGSTKKGKLNSATIPLNYKSEDITEDITNVKFPQQSALNYGQFISKQTHNQAEEINTINDITNVKFPQQSAENYGQFISKQTHNQAEEINTINDVHVGSTKKGKLKSAALLLNKKLLEHPVSISTNEETEDITNVKFPQQSAQSYGQFISKETHNQAKEINTINDVHVGSTKKGKLKSATLLLNKKLHEQPTNIFRNNKTEDMTNVKFPEQSAENYGQFISTHTHKQEEDINTINEVHIGTACHEDDNGNGSFLNYETELKAEVEMLREELREAADLEVSMYSVIAEHGSSSNKVHAPARRLSRFYFHACRVGSLATIASAAQSAVSGFVLVSKACGNDVPRLTFWFSNLILLRGIVSKGVETGNTLHKEEKDDAEKPFHSWEDPETFLVALEKVEAWIFSRIVESVWWQTLTPYMQSAAAKSSSSRKAYEKRYRIGDQEQGSFSIDLWKRAFKDACERLCPLRTGGLECGCLPVIARLVMEQLVSRLDVAMFNAILRESAEEMPMDPISDPISDSKVLPIPAGKSGFGAGAQLKNAIGDWSRWLSDLFSIDDSESQEVSNEKDEPKCESSFKPFQLLNALSDLMMLPLDMLADGSMRKEVCPRFGTSLIKRVVNNFVPDEFSPGPIPDAVVEALNEIEDDEGSITSFPCFAGSAVYAAPPASSVVGMLQEVGNKTSLRSGSFALKKLYTSDDELDELDSPLSAIGMDDSKEKFALVKGGRKVVRYELLREVWKSSD